MMKRYWKELGVLFLVLVLIVGIVEFVMPKKHTPYVRIMTAEVKRDYPLFHPIKDSTLQEVRAMHKIYPTDTIYALDAFSNNQMSIEKTEAALPIYLENIDELTLEEKKNIELKISGFRQRYVLQARFISILFLITIVVILATILNQGIYFFSHKKVDLLE